MTEQEARDRCAQLAEEHPDRFTHRWVATKRGDKWAVAKIGLPPANQDGTPAIRADEKPPTPDDPRTSQPWYNPSSGGFS